MYTLFHQRYYVGLNDLKVRKATQCLQMSQVEDAAAEDEPAEEQQPAERVSTEQVEEEAPPQPRRRGRPPKPEPAASEAAVGKKVRGYGLVA